MPEAEYDLKQRILDDVKNRAPSLDPKELSDLIDDNPYGNCTLYTLDRVFNNDLAFIPKDFPDIQKSYYDLALYYFRTYPIKQKTYPIKQNYDDVILNVLGFIAAVCDNLLRPSELPRSLGKSPIYAEVAREILGFYHENKDNIQSLDRVGRRLHSEYNLIIMISPVMRRLMEIDECRLMEIHERHLMEIYGGAVLEIKVKEDKQDPSVVRKMWEGVKRIELAYIKAEESKKQNAT